MIYIKIFVEIYSWRYKKLVYKTYRIIDLEKFPISRVINLLNPDVQQFYNISEILQSVYIVPKDIESYTSNVHNYIN